MTVETGDVRMRFDGVVPLGAGVDGSTLMKKDSVWEITGRDLFISMVFVPTASDAFVSVAYLKGE